MFLRPPFEAQGGDVFKAPSKGSPLKGGLGEVPLASPRPPSFWLLSLNSRVGVTISQVLSVVATAVLAPMAVLQVSNSTSNAKMSGIKGGTKVGGEPTPK